MSGGGVPSKRKGAFTAMDSRKAPRLTEKSATGKMTFAQRMMAKMGHVDGQGLGKSGEGMVNPIEVKLRPQGAGVGAVKEKTEQYKEEQRRAAERRGEEWEDSSEEERKARRKRLDAARGGDRSGGGSGGQQGPVAGPRSRKTKFTTVEEVRAAAPGLEMPATMLSSIVDATGSQTKLLTSTAGLMAGGMVKAESELEKVQRREKLEAEAYIEAWHGLQERKLHLEEHEGQLLLQLEQMEQDSAKLKSVIADLEGLQVVDHAQSEDLAWVSAVSGLQTLQEGHLHEIDSCHLDDAAVAVLAPPFKVMLDGWEPLENPKLVVDDILDLRSLLGISTGEELASNGHVKPESRRYRKQKATTAYETLMYRTWLPKVRATIAQWDPLESQPMIALVESWRSALPPFILSNVVDQLIVPKLTDALRAQGSKVSRTKISLPHVWLFPWLPHLPPYHLDASAQTGLLSDVRRYVRTGLSNCNIAAGPFPGLVEWKDLLAADLPGLLVRHLLPRLAAHLSRNFDIDPSNQDMAAFDAVLSWQGLFKSDIYARLFAAEFFPKLLAALHHWITSEGVDFEQVQAWLAWWRDVIPTDVAASKDTIQEWHKADSLVARAIDIMGRGGDVAAELPPPAAGPVRPVVSQGETSGARALREEAPRTKFSEAHDDDTAVQNMSLKQVIEEYCESEDLTMIPLREADPATGSPLFRITASATGRGGVVVYFRNEAIWAREKGKSDVYSSIGLDQLASRAEGK